MKRLDLYLLGAFLKVLVICFLSLTGLYIVIDVFGNLEEFIRHGERHGSLLVVIADYYGARVISFFDRTSAILVLIAVLFTITWFQRNNEMTAMMAGGVSKFRIVAPLILAALVVSVLATISRETVIPRVSHKLSRNAQDWWGERAKPVHPRYDNETDILFQGKHTVAKNRRIVEPHFRLPDAMQGFSSQLTAKSAFYHPPSADRPGGYLFHDVKRPENLDELRSVEQNGKKVILTPSDTPWLRSTQCFVVSNISFEQLEGGMMWRQHSSTLQLLRALRNPSLDFGADVRVTVHTRLVQPLIDMTLLFLGIPLLLSREQHNVFRAAGLCLLVIAAFYLIVVTCQGLGASYLISPALAAWCPLLVGVPTAIMLSRPLWE